MDEIDGWAGLDVAKSKIDVTVRAGERTRRKRVTNSEAGWRQLTTWLTDIGLLRAHVCLEATGRYGEGVAEALADTGHTVSVVNPAQVKDFIRARLGRNKTDETDADAICDFCRVMRPAPWTPLSPSARRLRQLVRTQSALVASRSEWLNRRGAGVQDPTAGTAIMAVLASLAEEIARLAEAIRRLIEDDPDLRRRRDLLASIPGIGDVAAAAILSELPSDSSLPTAKAVVAYAGLNPARRESGTWAGRSVISRIGSPALRRALFMPAMAAVRCNPMVMALKKRLSDAGRLRPKQILVAAMRKLLVLCWGILRSGRPFDPSYGQETRNYPAPA